MRGGVHQLVDERLHVEVQVDLVDRDRDFLAARSAEGGEDIAEGIDGRVGHRMQAIGDQHADIAGPGLARSAAAFDHQFARGGAFRNPRDDERIRADDDRRAHFADGAPWAVLSCAKPFPRICNSPPAMAAGGVTCEICGLGVC